MSRFKRIKNKTTKKSSVSIDEKIAALNKELEKTGILEEEAPTNSTSGVYSTSTHVPADPGGTFPVPDTSGVTGDGFTQPVSGNPDDPSNWPDAYANDDWLFNPNDVNGETNRPIVKSLDKGLIDAFNTAFPDNGKYPSGGGGIVFGDIAFGTSVGYAKDGHFKQVLSPGLHGNGSVNLALAFEYPYFGLTGQYFPIAGEEEANVIIGMSNLWLSMGGYTTEASRTHQIQLWRHHSTFHDGQYADWSGKKYTDSETGTRYVLQNFFMFRAGNTYDVTPTPASTKDPIIRGTEDKPIYPGPIASLFGLGQRAFDWLLNRIKSAPERWENRIQSIGMPIEVATSVSQNKPVNAPEPSDAEKQEFFDNLDPTQIFNPDHPYNIQSKGIPINSNGKVNYSDEVIYVDPNGDVQSNVGPNGEKEYYEKNTTTENSVTSTIGMRGQAQSQVYWSEEKGKWMFAFEDHAYDNLNTTDEGETAGIATKASEIIHQNADDKFNRNQGERPSSGRGTGAKPKPDNTSPNTGAMSNYPCNSTACIRGDSVLKWEIPVDEIENEEIRNKINAEIAAGKKQNESYISESVRLGHFEPDVLDVNIKDLRKGIMPEYPKKPPAEMIDGYHEKSRIKPKEAKNIIPTLEIDKVDLIRNHRLKSGEADDMINTINMINDHIKKHPEDFIHAQQRYPVDDPRLAELNWKMDQMLEAGEEYLDSNFKENKKLFNRTIDRTKKNIKLTDPEYVQQHYDELRGTTKPKKTKLVGRLGKHLNKYESKSFFKHVNSKDFKKISERKEQQKLLKLENETILNIKREEEEKYLDSVMKQVKYSWREYDAAAELREGMTTSNLTITQVAAQGEGEDSLATLDLSVADSFSDNTDRDAPVSGLKNTAIVDGGTGNGSMGGFDIGPHVRFRGTSQPRWATLNAVDTSVSDTIILSAIRGSDFNGGEIPDLDNEALQLWYHDSVNNAWRPLNQNPLGVTDNTVNHIIIPNVPGEGSIPPENKVLRDWTLTLPSWARGPEMKFMFYQAQHSGASYDHYGIKSVSYRRNTPLTVFAPLDSPEASAFIRMNPIPYNQRRKNIQDRLAPKSRKKNLEKMLEASDKYVATYLGPDFPGMNTEIVPITLQTFEQQSAAIEARDDLVSKIQSLAKPSVEKYTSMVDKNVSDYYARHYRESANDLNSFGQMYQNAIDTQNYDQANDLVRNASKNVVYALDGTMPIFDKSGELTQVPVRDRYGRVYNPNYKLTQEQTDKIDARYGVSTESALRARNESPFAYTLNTNFETTEELLEDDSYDLKSTDYITGPDPWSTGVSYSDPVDKQGGKSNTGSRYVPWYGGKGFRMFRGPDKPTTWDQKGWYPSRVGTNHWQGHRYDGLAYGAFRALYLGDERYEKKPANGMSQAANLAYYLNYANTSWHFKTDYTKTITYRNGRTVTTKHSRPGTNRCGMSYFSAWMEALPRLREERGLPPLTKDPLMAALREEQVQIPNVDEPIDQGEEGENKDKTLFGLEGVTDDFTELDFELSNEDGDGFTKDELDDMGNFWKDLLTHKPTRDDYDNTRSGAKRYSEDLKAYKQNQETIAKNTKIIDYYRNTLASIASRDENGKFDPEKYKANFKEGENSFFISSMDYEIGEVNFLLGSAAESNPFGSDIAAFDKENTLAYDFSNGVNLGLSSQNMADLFSGGGRRIVTAANGKSYTKFQDLDWEYKEDAINAFNAFRDSERDRLFTDVDFENLSFGDNVFSTQQAFQDHLNLERAKSMTANNLMYASLANRLVEVENGFTPVLGSKQDFGAMNDAGTKVSGQSFPPDTNFDLVPIDSDGFFTREFNANIDKPKGSNLTYTQIAQLNSQLSVVGDNGMRRLYQAQARGASEEELGAIAASIWQQEKPISDKLALDYDSMFSPDGKISPTLNSILNNPLSNAIKSLADVVTFDTFDIDNKGRSTNPIVNKINSSVRQLPGDAAMFIRYLTNTGPKVIDNKVLGQKRVETMIRNAETKGGGENALNFNDNIAGTTQEPVYKNGKINIAFNYDFEKNATEFQTAKENNAYVESWAGKIMKSITGSDNLGNKILEPLTKAMYNVMGEYSVDAQPSFPVVGTILGPIFGQAIETSKSVGGAKAIPGNVSITPKELYRLNPNLYREYVSKGVIPDTERDYYGGYNTGSRIIPYDQAPYFSKDKKKKEDEGTFDVNMNYFPPGFEDAIKTNEIGVTQGQFMPSNPPGMRQQGVGVSANDLSRNLSQAQINAALGKMMDRHDAALRKLKASQLNPNDKKSMDAVEKLVLAQEKERRPLVKALEIKPEQQGEPIFPSVAASTLTTAQSKALLDKGAEVERVADLLNLGATNKELNDLTKDIKVASHTIDKPLPKKLPSFGPLFKASLLARYLTGNNKQFTEKDLDNAQIQSMYMQTDQILRAKDTPAFGMDNGVSVLDLTNEMSDERKKAYGMEPGEKIYQVSSYQGDQVLENLKNNDLIYVLGRYVVITKPFLDAGAPEEKIKEIRDDFDFEYGFNAVRADGGVPGDDTIIGRVKGDETPGVPGTLTKGKGIFSGGIPSVEGIKGAEPIISLGGRSIVNIAQGLNVGVPFPIRIKFTDKNWIEKTNYEDDYPVYVKSNESKEPKRGKTLYEKVKKKVFFNPKDIKPEFPKDPPPELDPETGMHPEYGKHVSRYKKLDPHSADAMPDTGDPEIDAEVMKQKSGKKKKKLSDFKRNIK